MHFNGFVTFDAHTVEHHGNAGCPSGYRTETDFVAPYWLKYSQGTVHAYLLENNPDKDLILNDLIGGGLITQGFGNAGSTTVIVITWLRMRSGGTGVTGDDVS